MYVCVYLCVCFNERIKPHPNLIISQSTTPKAQTSLPSEKMRSSSASIEHHFTGSFKTVSLCQKSCKSDAGSVRKKGNRTENGELHSSFARRGIEDPGFVNIDPEGLEINAMHPKAHSHIYINTYIYKCKRPFSLSLSLSLDQSINQSINHSCTRTHHTSYITLPSSSW